MSGPVIIRLQNLPLEARSLDIRRFFEGLVIPDGGVHIIGGQHGDAFIAFQSDEDARLAMARNGGTIFSSSIRLYLSSKTEMQNVIASARTQTPTQSSLNDPTKDILSKMAPKINSKQTSANDLLSSLTSFISGNNNNNSAPAVATSSSSGSSGLDFIKSLMNGGGERREASRPAENYMMNSATVSNAYPSSSHLKSAASSSGIQPNLNIEDILSALNSQIKPNEANNNNNNNGMVINGLKNYLSAAAAASSAPPTVAKPYEQDYAKAFNTSDNYNGSFDAYKSKGPFGGANSFNDNGRNRHESGELRHSQSKFNGNKIPAPSSSASSQQQDAKNGAANLKRSIENVILVKNFNRNCSYKDIRAFLQGIQIEHDGIKLLSDTSGQRIGMAYVRLMSILDLKKALCRNGQFNDQNMIEVSQATIQEFDNPNINALLNKKSAAANNNNAKPNKFHQDNRPPHNNNGSNGNNYHVINNKKTESDGRPPFTNHSHGGNRPPFDITPSGHYIKIYGLPAKFDDKNLRNVFNNVKFVRIFTSTPIAFKGAYDGEPKTTYKAKKICEVETQLDIEKALTRQDERIGKSKLQIFQISKAEYEREISQIQRHAGSVGGHVDSDEEQGGEQDWNEANGAGAEPGKYFLHMTGVPFSAYENDVKAYFDGMKVREVYLLHDLTTMRPLGECCCSFVSESDRDRALEKDNQLFRNRVVRIKRIDDREFADFKRTEQEYKSKKTGRSFGQRNTFNEDSNDSLKNNNGQRFKRRDDLTFSDQLKNKRFRVNNMMMMMTNSGKNDNDEPLSPSYNNSKDTYTPLLVDLPPLPPELQQHRDCLVLLTNVAFDATREDILDLFKEFSPIEHTLKIRHDDQGKPTGDAIVACQSSIDANKACRHLNGFLFRDRNIKTSLIAP